MTIKIKDVREISNLEKLSLSEFSYSRIDTYDMCPSKYFFSYIQKEPRQFNGPAALGNVVHGVLEDCIEAGKNLSYEEMKDSYQKNLLNYDPSGLISEDLINAGDSIIEEFYDLNQETIFDVYGKEISFKFVIGNYILIGFIDRVDVVDDSVHIVDYKTGKREVAAKDVCNNLQLRNLCPRRIRNFSRKNHYSIPSLSENK